MENASKALIIAGAILLAILLIGVAMYVYQQSRGVINTDQLSSVEISTFNSPFQAYFGDSVNGSNVRALVNAVNSHNRQHTTDTTLQIELTGESGLGTNKTAYSAAAIGQGNSYEVKATPNTGYDASGYLKSITITKK